MISANLGPFAFAFASICLIRFIMFNRDFFNETHPENKRHIVRFAQIFSAKLILEVFGGVGAVWGFSDILTIRNDDTNEHWRNIVSVFGVIFFVRLLCQCTEHIENIRQFLGPIEEFNSTRFVQIFSAKLILEVFGGAGAIWGFSEICTLRRAETVYFWRPCSLVFAVIFFIRYCRQMQDFLHEMEYGEPRADLSQRSMKRLVQIFSAKLVLEVFGAGGAIWGFTEALTLRNPETEEFWRTVAQIVAVIFFARYLNQMKDFMAERIPSKGLKTHETIESIDTDSSSDEGSESELSSDDSFESLDNLEGYATENTPLMIV